MGDALSVPEAIKSGGETKELFTGLLSKSIPAMKSIVRDALTKVAIEQFLPTGKHGGYMSDAQDFHQTLISAETCPVPTEVTLLWGDKDS